MSTELSVSAKNDLAKIVQDNTNTFGDLLGPRVGHIQFVTSAIIEANKLPPTCTKGSVAKSVLNAAAMGLMFGEQLGHAYLVPFKSGDLSRRYGREVHECQLIVGYRGMLDLAFRNRFLKDCTAEVVLKNEDFRCWVNREGRQIQHDIPLGRKLSPANIVAAYCVYHTRGEGTGIVVVEKEQIDKAKNDKSDAWKYDYAAMAKKTAIRRASKEWQLTGDLASAVSLDEYAERGESQPNLSGVDFEVPEDQPKGDVLTLEEPETPPKPEPSEEEVGEFNRLSRMIYESKDLEEVRQIMEQEVPISRQNGYIGLDSIKDLEEVARKKRANLNGQLMDVPEEEIPY